MNVEAEMQEYLDEIRREVCTRCVERPAGGPPCGPLGKVCGVELHLPQLVAAVGEVQSPWMGPYLDSTHEKVCQSCPYLHQDCCPCPMDSLAMLVVEAIEAVHRRRERRADGRRRVESLPPARQPDLMAAVGRAYAEAAGTWAGCDWPTGFGPRRLDLNGLSVAEAEAQAVETAWGPEGALWEAAVEWLRELEGRAQEAERQAALALAAANAGAWREAAEHARQAWALEFHTGRPLRHAPAWQRLYQVIATTAGRQGCLELAAAP